MADADQDLRDSVRERAAASLIVHSETEMPEVLASAVGLAPDFSARKGDRRGRRTPVPNNRVDYESMLAEERSPSDHAAALAERLRPYTARIRELCAADGNWAVIHVVEHASIPPGWVVNLEAWVQPADLQTFADTGAHLVVDAYLDVKDD